MTESKRNFPTSIKIYYNEFGIKRKDNYKLKYIPIIYFNNIILQKVFKNPAKITKHNITKKKQYIVFNTQKYTKQTGRRKKSLTVHTYIISSIKKVQTSLL